MMSPTILFSIFFLSVSVSVIECVNPEDLLINGAQYVNCFVDTSSHNLLDYFPTPNVGYTASTCKALAVQNAATYFGLEDGGQCYYDTRLNHITPSNNCNMPCNADSSERCGGVFAIDVWELTQSTVPPTLVPNSEYLGCFVDEESPRALPLTPTSINPSDLNNAYTVSTCQAVAVANGAVYFGLEDGSQCFFGNVFTNLGADISCSSPCSNGRTQRCGGVWALDVYANLLTPTTLPGTTYLGCYKDQASVPALNNNAHSVNPNDPNNAYSAEICQTLSKLAGVKYFGLEDGGECFFSNSFNNYGPSSGCNMTCTASPLERCGGYYAIDLWQNN